MAVSNLREEMYRMYCLDEDSFNLFSKEEKVELIKNTLMTKGLKGKEFNILLLFFIRNSLI